MVKIRSVTDETFLIWTNVARTNVAWINVTMTIATVKDGPKKLPLKFDQSLISNR